MQEESYDDAWFRARAFNSLKKIDEGLWDYSDSVLLYIPEGEESFEAIQEEGNLYAEIITKPETDYLKDIAPEIVAQLPEEFEYIDLGPGTAHKEQFIFDEAKKANKRFTYMPVDISSHYLTLAETYASAQGIPVKPIKAPFEDLAQHLSEVNIPRFVSIGLTFSNYLPEEIIALLHSIAGKKGSAFINVHIRDRNDMEKVKEIYIQQVARVFNPKIRLLGLKDEDILEKQINDGVEVWYTLRNSNPELEAKGIHAGDKMLVFRSLRYTKESLEKAIAPACASYAMFDHGGPFIGVLLKW